MRYKPKGYTSLAPYLLVRDAEATMTFLEAAFAGERLRVIPRDGGGIMHAEVRIDDTVVMLGEAQAATAAHLHLYVADPEACFERALAAGATTVQPLKSSGDGDLRGGVEAPDGTVWWIAKEL
ncbi:MAG: VOC family protein [Sulfitobacter sp.]